MSVGIEIKVTCFVCFENSLLVENVFLFCRKYLKVNAYMQLTIRIHFIMRNIRIIDMTMFASKFQKL